ncbi:hypothetical protein DFH11DRAFT_1855513 [Phellopilus nigrolimitatus]|nr:hypothetical protein DFH11DRAFT_1855513 [Phellopilus nigrolimitatus]
MDRKKGIPGTSISREFAYLDFQYSPCIPLQPITLPPSLSQRKRVHAWSVILSGISDRERRQCVEVSRMFRYAVYLSAVQIIKRDFGGRRFAQISQQYNLHITNFWPYLNRLRDERDSRSRAYNLSFLPRFFGSWNPISKRLWASPDHERQLAIALRFIITRVWFAISVNGRDQKNLRNLVVTDANEIVRNEVWSVTVNTTPMLASSVFETFYVIQSTCEVIGLPSPAKAPAINSDISLLLSTPDTPSLRVDWSDYVENRLLPDGSHTVPPPPLLSYLKWTNAEEYTQGISKLWLSRIAKEGEVGEYKMKVAERYVMACVMGNSVSGQWMSSNHMAQVFAGTTSLDLPDTRARRKETPKVNLFLPADYCMCRHHLVESVHFTTGSGRALHPALAVVQTPGREYFILRDNGMEVGCEEDGVWPTWMELLNCNGKGLRR